MRTMLMMNPVCLKFVQAIFMVCLVLQVNLFFAKEVDLVPSKVVRCVEREREALLQFKGGLVDKYGMMSSWKSADCCQWKGIRCSKLTGHILMLDLHGESLMISSMESSMNQSHNFISAKIYLGGYGSSLKIDDGNHARGQWLSNLTSLIHLHLVGISNLNSSYSWMQMIGKLPKLRELNLIKCGLSDHFIHSPSPSRFNSSSSLSVIDLSQNTFTSSIIFQWVSNISSNLVELDLSENLLEDSPSNHFGIAMNSLEKLDLSGNSLKGGVVKSFMNICTLRSLDLSENNFTEDLPSILHNLSSGCVVYSLQELNLGYNQITGLLPDLSIFSSLKTLDLSSNRLSGKIPEGSILPSQLESLSISSNSLEGGVPKSFGNACSLSSLDLSINNLSEELPMIIHQLSGCARYSLQKLGLSTNQINGTLPNFSIFSSLKELYLDENRLNGKIREDIRFPIDLETLDIHSNALEGVITESHFANMSKLMSLTLSDNSLVVAFSQNWVPSFQLREIWLRSCKLGPTFPKWLQTQNYIANLDISNCGISDVVPEWFWAKIASPDLATMNISYNNLKGVIPNVPVNNTPSSLNLASNQFEGPIPPFLRDSVSLDLSENKFSDSRWFLCANNGSTETLAQLDLSSNQLSGKIPHCWSYFKSLVHLDLSHNNFSGKIPSSMGSLLELEALLLRNNSLTEGIPFSLRSCTKLVMLDVAENRLSRPIPSWIGSKFQELQILSLRRNHFCGSLPLQLCYLKSIQLLDLSLNNLSGQIPKCFKNFTSMAQKTSSGHYLYYNIETNHEFNSMPYSLNAILTWKGSEQMFKNNGSFLLKSIDLSSNHFSEEIPIEIVNLFDLVSLNLSGNNLTGEIPSNIGRLTSLEFLDLSRNQISGSIPSSLARIDRLTMLDLSHNHLSGEIPISTQLQSFDASSYEDNLDLCGKPLDKLCNIEAEPPKEPIVKSEDEDEDLLVSRGFYVSMAFGFVIGFWGIFGSILVSRSLRHAYFRLLKQFN
ncbi:receptor-like protein EIX2 [Gastrolobium bilobum]|uniref:receptor-like protein EIX2 n=1 Tax=Gastrolobium bilobum TaxID=150636 RepID=UPI002AB30B6F|nr:receptor-like protein EIX2 [Gastrolobium bilobum]